MNMLKNVIFKTPKNNLNEWCVTEENNGYLIWKRKKYDEYDGTTLYEFVCYRPGWDNKDETICECYEMMTAEIKKR